MTLPPVDSSAPQLRMTVRDVFHLPGRGTMLAGQLEGQGWLNVGDTVVCERDQWSVRAIELFGGVQTAAGQGANVGVLLRNGPPADLLRGKTVEFVSNPARIGARPARGLARKLRRGSG